MTISNDTTILNILENLLAYNIELNKLLDVTSRQTHGENTNQNLVESTVEEDKRRLSGKCVLKNVFNLSHRALTDSEIRVLYKELNFVRIPEKVDRFQLKNDIERVGREIKLKMHFKTEPTVAFSEKPAKRQLNNTKVYEKWSGNPLQKVNTEIKSVLRDMLNRKEIDKKIMDYLLIKRPQLGGFYLLPKIHKRTSNIPGRPVVANNGTATENVLAFLDFHLKTIVPTIPHIAEDTRDFLSL